ncbi:MAG: PspA/IM30 family protein [Cyanobacteria bacterium]|jgi:phage shock protein A|nr:PspA/IM30 family protein [Cyanobacteria bacterium GSL.Bin1]
MGLFDRISRVVRANVNDLVSKAEDPEKMLEQALVDMNEDLVQLRQAVAKAIAAERRSRKQYEEQQSEANKWQQRAQLALSKGQEDLARQALQRKKSAADAAAALKPQVDQQKSQVDTLKKSLIALESKISEAKTKKEMLGARMKAAKANQQLQEQVGNLSGSSAMGAFERMEEKVMEMEASGQAAAELVGGGGGIEDQFAQLESGSDVDDELAAMKAQLSGSSQNQQALPEGDQQSNQQNQDAVSDSEMDAELEALRRQLDG